MSDALLRVQDKDGRGPFKPGFTKIWCEYNHKLPSILEEFPGIVDDVRPFHSRGFHLGCGVRDGKKELNKWFSETELKKLDKLGYKIVSIDNYEVVKESKNQVIFATKKPLSNFQEYQERDYEGVSGM